MNDVTENRKENDTSPRLLICEFADEVAALVEYCRRKNLSPASFTVLALQPQARVECQKLGLTCLDTIDFFSNSAHRDALSASHRFTSLLAGEFVLSSSLPLRQTLRNTFLYYVRFYLNNYMRLLEVLKTVQRRFPGATIYTVCGGPPLPVNPAGEPFLNNGDRFVSRLAGGFCRRHGLSSVEIDPPPGGERRPVAARASGDSRASRILRALWRRWLARLGRSPTILLAAPSYNLDRLAADISARFPALRCAIIVDGAHRPLGQLAGLLREWLAAGRRPVRVPLTLFNPGDAGEERRTAQAVRDAWAGFMGRRASDFYYANISLAEELTGKVVTDLAGNLGWLARRTAAQNEVLQGLRPRLLISPVAVGGFQAWAELGRRLKIPTLVIPQKGLVAPTDETAGREEHYIGRAQVSHEFTFAAAQSPLVADYLRWAGYGGRVVPTGNLIFARRRPRPAAAPADRPLTIVYAPSMKSRKSCRFHVLETLDELVASLADLLAAVAASARYRLIVRIHPGEPISRRQLEALLTLPENVSVSDRGPFDEVLAHADLLISYSSTSIQEALLNHVPVLLYDRWRRYNHLGAPRVGAEGALPTAAAFYVDSAAALPSVLAALADRLPLPEVLFRPYTYPAGQDEQFYRFVQECLDGAANPPSSSN